MEQEIAQAAKKARPDYSAMGFMFILAILQLYYYTNPPGEGFSRDVAMAYIVIPAVFLIYYSAGRPKVNLDRFTLPHVIFYGLIGFLVTWAFMLIVYGKLLGVNFGTVPASAVWGTVITQVMFVACSEELAFRYIIPTYLRENWPHAKYLPMVLASAAFALFHSAAYGGNYQSMGLAFMVGMVWLFLYEIKINGQKIGLGFTIGSHAAYNLVLVGVLAGNITMISGGI
jgi:hypothetical protein